LYDARHVMDMSVYNDLVARERKCVTEFYESNTLDNKQIVHRIILNFKLMFNHRFTKISNLEINSLLGPTNSIIN